MEYKSMTVPHLTLLQSVTSPCNVETKAFPFESELEQQMDAMSTSPSPSSSSSSDLAEIATTFNPEAMDTPSPTISDISENGNNTDLSPPSSVDSYDSDLEDLPLLALFQKITKSEEDITFAQHGYKKIGDKICDTLQGELYKAENVRSSTDSADGNPQYVAIKKICKDLSHTKLARDEDGLNYVVSEDIAKEALLLKHLTVDNEMMGDYLVQFIDFFETDTNYYLVTEWVTGMNLNQFIQIAHQYVGCGKLDIKEYTKVIKYIMWQLTTTLHFLHDIYHCCHLDLSLENIMLKDVRFVERMDGSIYLPATMTIKIVDFGVAEIFDTSKVKDFTCSKQGLTVNNSYQSPSVTCNQSFDARAADMWSLGMIFYKCITNKSLYQAEDIWEEPQRGYWAIINDKLMHYLRTVNHLKYFNRKSFEFLNSLLRIDEEQRLTASKSIQHEFFKSYFKKYHAKLTKKNE